MKMLANKKILLYGFLLGSIASTSCKKYLDYQASSNETAEDVFASTTTTNSAVIAVYNSLAGDYGFGYRAGCILPMSADDFRTSGSYSASDRRGISMYGANSANVELVTPFAEMYQGIERANLCIKYIQASDLYTSGTTAQKALMATYLGECYALRAQFYSYLIENWGDVPAYFIPAATDTSVYKGNVNRDSTLSHVISDLATAEGLVGWRTDLTAYGSFRFTKGAIKALRARIALQRAGYSLRTASHTMERSSDYLTYVQIAHDECEELMNNRTQHTLNPSYENVFKTLHGTTSYDAANELMFTVAAYGGSAQTDSKLGYYNGLSFNTSSSYGRGGGGVNAIPTYFYEFDTIDCRRDVTIGAIQINASTLKTMNTLFTLTDAKFRKSWTSYDNSSSSQYFNINWPVLRFADVLLMFAETENELNGPTTAAVSALQEVQKRAYVNDVTAIPAAPTTKDAFFTAIVKERLLEFGGEGLRKYDLIRWNLLDSVITATRAKLVALANGTGAYASVPLYVYVKPNAFLNTTSTTELNNLPFSGGTPNSVFYNADNGASSTAPTGYTLINWRKSVTEANSLTSNLTGFAYYYEANKKELLPYPLYETIENKNLVQNYGY